MAVPHSIAEWALGELKSRATWPVSADISEAYGAALLFAWYIGLSAIPWIPPVRRTRRA